MLPLRGIKLREYNSFFNWSLLQIEKNVAFSCVFLEKWVFVAILCLQKVKKYVNERMVFAAKNEAGNV